GAAGKGAAVVYLPKQHVLFAGPFVYNGVRAQLPGAGTALWLKTLHLLGQQQVASGHITPGFGTWGRATIFARQKRLLTEMRGLVGHLVAQGWSLPDIQSAARVSPEFLTCTPHDNPVAEDFEHVYHELTVPFAPFKGRVPKKGDPELHALVLI